MMLEDAVRKIQNIPEFVFANRARLQTVSCKAVETLILTRIFVDGKASDGNDIGPTLSRNRFGAYSEKYGKLRASKGFGVGKVDLQFEGDLFKSIKTGTSNGEIVVGIDSVKQTEIAEKQEKVNFKKDIFRPTESEIKVGQNAFVRELNLIIKEVISAN